MKKRISILSALCLALGFANAQTIDDAFNFAENDYYGTARTMGMGGAMTAVGSDPGSFAFNPAGSAVAKYSQVSVTPGVSISGTKAHIDNLSGSSIATGQARFIVPNIAATLRFDTGRISGVKAVTIGFTTHMTNNFNRSYSCGATTNTSYAGRLAYCANTAYINEQGYEYGYTADQLKGDYGDQADWLCMLCYKTGMIRNAPGASSDFWTGVSEDYREVQEGGEYYDSNISHPVNTDYYQRTYGSKLDYIFNIGLNISDVVFLGANLGLQSYRYCMEDYLTESKTSGELYSTRFNRLSNEYIYNCSGTGVYGKFGILVTPVGGLRIGAALTTPTVMNISENWENSVSVRTDMDSSGDGTITSSGRTPLCENCYKFVSPLRFNTGLAYTLGSFAIASVDYELVNYGRSEFRRVPGWPNDFSDVNSTIRGADRESDYEFLGRQHMLRAGLELKPFQGMAVRLGYGFASSGINLYRNGLASAIKANTHSASFGLGYDSQGSFFADIACRLKWCPAQYTKIYGDYHSEYFSPEVTSRQLLTTIVATIGWRF